MEKQRFWVSVIPALEKMRASMHTYLSANESTGKKKLIDCVYKTLCWWNKIRGLVFQKGLSLKYSSLT